MNARLPRRVGLGRLPALGAALALSGGGALAEPWPGLPDAFTPENIPAMMVAVQSRGDAVCALDEDVWKDRLEALLATHGFEIIYRPEAYHLVLENSAIQVGGICSGMTGLWISKPVVLDGIFGTFVIYSMQDHFIGKDGSNVMANWILEDFTMALDRGAAE